MQKSCDELKSDFSGLVKKVGVNEIFSKCDLTGCPLLFQSDLVGHMGTMAPGTILLLLWSALACSLAFAATRPPILDLTEELLRDIEKAQAQTARGEEVATIFKNVQCCNVLRIMIKTRI